VPHVIFICGATGNFGGKVLRRLLELGEPVRGLTHSAKKAAQLEQLGATAVIGDMDDAASMEAALLGVDRVFLVSPMDEAVERREKNVIAAAQKAGVHQVVKLHGAVRHRGDRLSTLHEASIEALKASGLRWTLVSPNSVMETALLTQADSIRTANMFVGAAGDGKVGLVAGGDCAQAAAVVLTEDPERHHAQNYEITGPESLTFAEFAERFSRVLGRTITYLDLPEDEFRRILVEEAGFSEETVEIDVLCHFRAYRRGDADVLSDAYTRLTGNPSTSVDTFIAAHREAFGG